MRKHFLLAAGIVLTSILAISCSQESLTETSSSNEALVSLNVTLPGSPATRVYSDGYSATNLSYAVYEKNNSNLVTQGTATFDGSSLTTTVTVALLKSMTYEIAFWAQATGAPYTFDADAQTVTVDYSGAVCNDETWDAFYAVVEYTPENSTGTLDVDLYRPLAQINFLTSDFDENTVKDYVASMQSSIAITGYAYKTLNLLTGEASDGESVTFTAAAIPTSEVYGEVPVADYDYVAMAYVLVGATQNEDNVYKDTFNNVTLNATSSNEAGNTMDVKVSVDNIPVQRNYRTNIYGDLLTEQTTVNVEIIPAYDGNYPISYPVTLSATSSDGSALTVDETTGVASVDVEANAESYSFNISVDESTSWTVTADNAEAELSYITTTALTKADEEADAEEEAETTEETTYPSISGTGPATITVEFPVNTVTEAVTTNVSVVAEGAGTLTIAITQAAAEETYTLVGDGTIENPYTVADVIYLLDNDSADYAYVTGTISSVSSYNSTYGSLTYYIADEDGNEVQVYSGLGLGSQKFTSTADLSEGDAVVIYGQLQMYYETYEINYNNYLVSLNGVTEYLYASVSTITVSAEAGSTSFTVTSNVEYDLSSEYPEEFVASVADDGTVTIEYTANETEAERSNVITMTPPEGSGASLAEVIIYQSAAGSSSLPTFTSSLEWTLGASASYSQTATVNETSDVSVLKLGTGSAAGSATMTIPSGSTGISFYGVSWKSRATTLSLTVGETTYTQDLAVNDGATSNSPYTITVTESDYYTIDFGEALAEDTEATVTTVNTSGSYCRIILWGINPVTAEE